jgi:hypothetical protein
MARDWRRTQVTAVSFDRAQEIVEELAGCDKLGPVQSLVLTQCNGGYVIGDDDHSEPADLSSEEALREQIARWLQSVGVA